MPLLRHCAMPACERMDDAGCHNFLSLHVIARFPVCVIVKAHKLCSQWVPGFADAFRLPPPGIRWSKFFFASFLFLAA